MWTKQNGEWVSIESILNEENAILIGIQEPLFEGDDEMVLFNFSGSPTVHGIKISELTKETIRNKRR